MRSSFAKKKEREFIAEFAKNKAKKRKTEWRGGNVMDVARQDIS